MAGIYSSLRPLPPPERNGEETVNLTKKELKYMQDMISIDIGEFYDDPSCCDSYEDIKKHVIRMKNICEKFKLNFDEVVKEEANEYEIKRIEAYLKGEEYDR